MSITIFKKNKQKVVCKRKRFLFYTLFQTDLIEKEHYRKFHILRCFLIIYLQNSSHSPIMLTVLPNFNFLYAQKTIIKYFKWIQFIKYYFIFKVVMFWKLKKEMLPNHLRTFPKINSHHRNRQTPTRSRKTFQGEYFTLREDGFL